MTIYPAIFYKEKDGSYSVVFPDLNHLATDGSDFNEAMEMAIDCLAGYIYSEKRDGNTLSPPTPIDKIDPHCEDDCDDDYESVFVNAVYVDVEQYVRSHFGEQEKAINQLDREKYELSFRGKWIPSTNPSSTAINLTE